MHRILRFLAVALLFSPLALAVPAGPLVRISHAGRLLDSSDNPVQGEHDFTFLLHSSAGLDPAVPDETVWTSAFPHVKILNGVYSVELGATEGGGAALPANLLATSNDLWLGVKIDDGPELKPRLRLSSVPLAARAASADTLAGELPASFHDAAKLTGVAPLAALQPAVDAAKDYTDAQVAPLATSDAVLQALAEAKTYADTKVAPLATSASVTQGLADAKAYADTKTAPLATSASVTQSLADAKAYTDTKTASLATSASVTQALSDAKGYTDTKVAGYLPLTGGALGTTSGSPAAILDLTATNRGFLPPRLTTAQRDAIAAPPKGLVVYNSTTDSLNVFNGTWVELAPKATTGTNAVYDSVASFKAAGGYAYFPLNEPGLRAYDRVDGTRYVEGSARQVAGYFDNTPARYFDDYADQMRGPSGKWLTGDAAHTFVITFRVWGLPGAFESLASLGYVETARTAHSVSVNSLGKLGGGFFSDDYWNGLDGAQQPIGLDTWVQAAWAYNPADHKVSLYRNGVLVGAATGASGATAKNFSNDFTIGGWVHTNGGYPGEKQVKESIAEVALFNTTLDAATVASLYQNGFQQKKRLLAP